MDCVTHFVGHFAEPNVVIEVLSDSTAAWDRGGKFWHYRQLDSISDDVLVSQDAWLIEHHTRRPTGAWLLETVEGAGGVLEVRSIASAVPLSEIYAETDLQPEVKPAAPPATSQTGPQSYAVGC